MAHWTEKLREINACLESIHWAERFPTVEEAWKNCNNSRWLIWFAAHADPREAILAVCDCIEKEGIPYLPEERNVFSWRDELEGVLEDVREFPVKREELKYSMKNAESVSKDILAGIRGATHNCPAHPNASESYEVAISCHYLSKAAKSTSWRVNDQLSDSLMCLLTAGVTDKTLEEIIRQHFPTCPTILTDLN